MDDPSRLSDPPPSSSSWPVHGPPVPLSGSSPGKPRRRWPWIVAVLLLLGVSGAATAVAIDQRDTAELWRDRAVAVQEQRDDALDRGDALQAQVDELTETLGASEDDVVMLEERIRQLADEKAQAEDEATTVQVERDLVAELTADIASATDALDGCVDRLFELQAASVAAFNESVAGDEVDVEPLNAQARETTQFCNDARTAAARASSAAQQLTAP